MAVEDYLLAWNKPLAIIFICLIFIFVLIALVIKGDYKIILRVETLPYFLILIIFIAYTATTSNNENLSDADNLFNYVVLHNHIKKKEDKQIFFKELKGVVLDMLDKNNTYSDTIKDNIAEILLSKLPSSFKDSKEGNIDIKIIKAILYTKDTNVEVGIDNIEKIFTHRTADEKNKVKYKNYIDDLFNLIINDNEPNSNNLYIKYYIYGLIKNKDDNDKNRLKDKLIRIKSSIQAYYIVVFVLYCLILVVILITLMGGLQLCFNYIRVY
jgi:energy-coupling factor transporter transmembrane protein EcfT